MRVRRTANQLTVQAISGTYVVLLGLDLPKNRCNGLMGFAIHRTDHTEGEAYWLKGLKTFAKTDPELGPGSTYSTREHPIQGFTWSDFSAKPGHRYTYKVLALKGEPDTLAPFATVSVTVTTEDPDGGNHDVYFNRGAAASQEYARHFKNQRPSEPAHFAWLSRGCHEAIVAFIALARNSGWSLRVAAYEFHEKGVLDALRQAKKRKVDVKIVYDRRQDKPGRKNDAAVKKAGLQAQCTRRKATKSAIAHNKFIVLLKGSKAVAVLTGGTNFSEGGIFGHSNAVHIVEMPKVADAYLTYWKLLDADPENAALRPDVTASFDVPADLPPNGTRAVFSPRSSDDALQWYGKLAASAKDGLFATFAFGMHEVFQKVYRTSKAGMRFALLEKATRPMKKGPARTAEEKKIRALRSLAANRFAIGAHLRINSFDRWLAEKTSGLNRNVQYVHTKYMLIDPLGDVPILVAGSANFSKASSTDNDENMLVIRGNRRVAEIYLGEFMRLYNHYAFREWLASGRAPADATPQHLRTNDWWKQYFGNTERSRQREYFASA